MIQRRYFLDSFHPILQLFLLALLVTTLLPLFTLLGMILVGPLFGVRTIDVIAQTAMSNPDSVAVHMNEVNALKFLQFMSSIGAFMLPAVIFSVLKFPEGDFLKVNTRMNFSLLLISIVLLAVSGPVISMIYALNREIHLPSFLSSVEETIQDYETRTENVTNLFLKMPSPLDLTINLIVMAFIPAISEELLFRGCMQQIFREWFKNIHWAIWVTAFIFSFIHMEFYGFFPRLLLGALLGYLFYWSGSLWVPIIAHALNNGGQVLLVYLHDHGLINFDINSDELVPVPVVLISTIICIGLLLLFKRVSDQHKFIY